jgi:glycosyltransferase involved in cell wall biosynthesis
VAESLPALAAEAQLELRVEDPATVAPELARRYALRAAADPAHESGADLDLYHLGNSPAHGYVYRAALARPGVVVLHDWSLHHLVLRETVEQGDVWRYLREMRRSHGERGSFVGRQVARALGGDLLPALFPLNERVLENSLAVVGLTAHVSGRAARALPGRPVLQLPHHLALPFEREPSRGEARRRLGLAQDALVVTAPGLATASKRLELAIRVAARLRRELPRLLLVVAGGLDARLGLEELARDALPGGAFLATGRLPLEDFVLHLCAADVVLALRFPSHGEISGALVRALGVGRAALVSDGTPASEEFPAGVVVPVDPGPYEEAELEALLGRLLRDPGLRESIERAARAHVRSRHDLAPVTRRLAGFLREVLAGKPRALEALAREQAQAAGLLGYFLEETRWAARDLGLSGLRPGLAPLLSELAGGSDPLPGDEA